jgi:hypothetical protein
MPSANDAALNPLELLGIVLAVGACLLVIAKRSVSKVSRWKWRRRQRAQWQQRERRAAVLRRPSVSAHDRTPANLTYAADQLRIVMDAPFGVQPLLNKSEARVFKELDQAVSSCNPAWRVMAQVSMGEILLCNDVAAYRCINSKRVDLLLIDGDCQPRHAIEYQGGAHHQGTAAARDAVKKEALRRAGVGYHEVVAGFTTPAELRRLVERLVDRPHAPASVPGALLPNWPKA